MSEDLIPHFPREVQEACIRMTISILCVDGRVDLREFSYVKRLAKRMK